MLHISGKTSRTMAFRKSLDGYNWIGEQEIFKGPNEYKTVDGTFKEQVCLTYEIEKISGFPQNRLNITYAGEDPRLAGRQNLFGRRKTHTQRMELLTLKTLRASRHTPIP
jgi:hypothetical protein